MHLQKGKQFFDQDDLTRARIELEAAYQLRPHDEKVLNMLGMTYYKLEMLPEAEEMYIVLAGRNPDVYALQSNLGLIQLKLNKLTDARDSLNRALELQPSNSKAHFYMGLLCEKQELWDDALSHFEQAKAEKMVAKMQSRLEETRNKPELVLPFQVVEVMDPHPSNPLETDLGAVVSEAMAQLSAADGETTSKMRTQDLAEAMFQIHQEEVGASQEPGSEDILTPVTPFQPVFIEPQEPLGSPEEESQEDTGDSMAQRMKEEIRVETEWEKTHPSLFPPSFEGSDEDSEINSDSEPNFLSGPTLDEPFFLSEDIAADISTFLAQSRTQESVDEDVFYSEPVIPELTVLRGSDAPEAGMDIQEETDQSKIPTPEEVENEIAAASEDAGSSSKILSEFAASLQGGEPLIIPHSEEMVEELSDEVRVNNEQPMIANFSETEEQEEDLEVNFAVTESEEEGEVKQGFLQPSPLTPVMEEEQLEQTQDMADTMPSEDATSTVQAQAEQDAPTETITAESPEPVEANVAETLVEAAAHGNEEQTSEPSEAPAQKVEELESQVEPETPVRTAQQEVEVFHPVNLDQFSKDRHYLQPLIGSDRFLLIDPHLLEIIISEQLICRSGTISSYTGNLEFAAFALAQAEQLPLIQVTGSGILFVADRRKEIFLISLNNEVLYVESNHLLVAQASLKIEPQFFQSKSPSTNRFAVMKISGRGTLALTCRTKPLTVNVHRGLPANIPAQAVIAWSGNLGAEILDDPDLRKVMMASDDDSLFLRFQGTGDVVVEQGGLWGDRRTKRS